MSEVEPGGGLSEDHLLDGRVRLRQPERGYRVAIDPVLLAAAVPAAPGERVLDAGMGTGAATLCLALRAPECRIVGIERERRLQRLASDNVALNGLQGTIDPMLGDLAQPPPRLAAGAFDHVMTNPPYQPAESASPSGDPERSAAHVEGELDLATWLATCLRMLRQRGLLTLIQRADRLDAVLAALHGRAGDIVVFPLWPNAGARSAKRILVQARKGTRGPAHLVRGMHLHEPGGGYTAAADAVLRHGQGLALTEPAEG